MQIIYKKSKNGNIKIHINLLVLNILHLLLKLGVMLFLVLDVVELVFVF